MLKSEVIAIRDMLHGNGDQKYPIRVLLDNQHFGIDESAPGVFVEWNDDAEVVSVISIYGGNQADSAPSNAAKAVTVHCAGYSSIQAIELCPIHVSNLENVLISMQSAGFDLGTVTDEKTGGTYSGTEVIPKVLDRFLSMDITKMGPRAIEEFFGKNINNKDDYYSSKYAEPFKETVRYREHNQKIDAAKS